MTRHKSFNKHALEVAETVTAKDAAYGEAFEKSGEMLRMLYPDGIAPEQYSDMLAVVRVIDKLFRIATDKDAFGESPWRDICGYAILAIERTSRSTES